MRVVFKVERERKKARGWRGVWFASWDVYQGRKCVGKGINAAYYRTPRAALKAAARFVDIQSEVTHP